MLSDFEQTMQLAAQESERHGHSYLGTEHALLGLLRTSNARALRVLRSRGLTAETVEAELGRLEAENVLPRRDGGRELLRDLGIDVEEVVRSPGSFVRSRRGRRRDLRRDTSVLVASQSQALDAVGEARAREARARARRTTRARGRTRAGDDRRRRRWHPARRKGFPRDTAQPPRQALAPATRSCSWKPRTRAFDRRSARAQARPARPPTDSARPIRRVANPTGPTCASCGGRARVSTTAASSASGTAGKWFGELITLLRLRRRG